MFNCLKVWFFAFHSWKWSSIDSQEFYQFKLVYPHHHYHHHYNDDHYDIDYDNDDDDDGNDNDDDDDNVDDYDDDDNQHLHNHLHPLKFSDNCISLYDTDWINLLQAIILVFYCIIFRSVLTILSRVFFHECEGIWLCG